MIRAEETLSHFLAEDYLRGRWLDPKTRQQMEISIRLLDRFATETGRPSPLPVRSLNRNR